MRYRDMWDNLITQYQKSGKNPYINKQLELILINKAGKEFYGETSIIPIYQAGKSYFCTFIQDITKRKEAEKQLYKNASFLNNLLANMHSGVLVFDDDNKVLFINQRFCDLRKIKQPIENLIGKDAHELISKYFITAIDSIKYEDRILDIMKSKQIIKGEVIENQDGQYIERDYIPIKISSEETIHLWKIEDITQRMMNQRLLKQSEIRSKLIMNASLNAIVTIDINEKITFWNYQATTIFGWTRKEMANKNMSEIILPQQYIDPTTNEIKEYKKINDIHNLKKPLELKGITKKGKEIILELNVIPIKANDEMFFCASIQDISERKEAEYIRKIQEEKYQNIITNMNIGLLEVDNTQHIQYANQSFATMSGYELKELIGKKPSDFFNFGENLDVIKSKTDSREQASSDLYQISIKNKRGELKWWAISGAPNYDNKGDLIGSIGIHLDITEQKQLEIDLEIEKTNAIESSKAKEVFLANMSHEIRTPLNAIIGFLRELDKQELTELQKKYINNSTTASKHLLAIINNILDISKIEAGEMSLENEDFVFEKSISTVSTVLQPMLEQKGLEFKISISKEIEKVLKGDTLRLQQILFNLVGNAIKFTDIGSISINCEVVNNNPFSQELQISISDTGIGMESSYLDNIFNKFSQEDKATTRKYGGTGLGLSITKELVRLMNGRIEIESEKNVGTTIRFYIHFQKGNKENIENLNVENITPRIDNISILLVEDNYLNRMVAQNTLQYYNCKVIEAENGLEAIEILKKNKFDIILMDIQMPQMGGIEATEIIRKKLFITTPIIAFTANAFKTEIDKCKKAGMDDFVTKPFDEDILIETIAKYTVNKNLPKPESLQTDKHYNLSSLYNLSKGNTEFVTKMITIFVEQTTDSLNKITTAINLNNFVEASRLIHKIRPSVESLEITTIIKELKHLEKITKETSDKEQISALFYTIKEILDQAIVQLTENELNI
jgi:PAS domain S-box-containing protein